MLIIPFFNGILIDNKWRRNKNKTESSDGGGVSGPGGKKRLRVRYDERCAGFFKRPFRIADWTVQPAGDSDSGDAGYCVSCFCAGKETG